MPGASSSSPSGTSGAPATDALTRPNWVHFAEVDAGLILAVKKLDYILFNLKRGNIGRRIKNATRQLHRGSNAMNNNDKKTS